MSVLAHVFQRLRARCTVDVLWRTEKQTSLWAPAWDGFWPFTKPQMYDGQQWPGKPLILPRFVHHLIQHIAPSTMLDALLWRLGVPPIVAALAGAVAFGCIPHIVGVWITRSYPLDPRDCLADLWSSSFPLAVAVGLSIWHAINGPALALSDMPLALVPLALWCAGYDTYVRWWASP